MSDVKQVRIPFIVFGDKDVRFSDADPDTMWEVDTFGMSVNRAMQAVRGYMTPGYIQFYIGAKKQTCQVNPRVLDSVVREHYARFGTYPNSYGSGVGADGKSIRTYNLRDYYRSV